MHCALSCCGHWVRALYIKAKSHWRWMEYDEYEYTVLKEAESQGGKCLTAHEEFKANMLSEGVLEIDVYRYLEDNWPMDDEDLEKIHKLKGLVTYQQCSL